MRIKICLSILATVILALILGLIYAYYVEPRRLVVKHVDLKVKNWNPALNDLRIAVLSDIHAGSNYVTEARLRQIVELTNQAQPDLIVMLGDFISPNGEEFELPRMPATKIAENLKGLHARYGVYAVFGNSDLWAESALKREFAKVGIRLLENEVVVIQHNGAKLRLFGLEDHLKFGNWGVTNKKWKKILENSEQEGDLVVLEHSPDVLPIITGDLLLSRQLRLILAGHTHGGQFWFPLIGSPIIPSSYGQRYAYGHVRENGIDMFVTTGIGTSILPIRFLVPPEIVILNIIAED